MLIKISSDDHISWILVWIIRFEILLLFLDYSFEILFVLEKKKIFYLIYNFEEIKQILTFLILS